MASYHHAVGIMLKDFGAFTDEQSKRLRMASLEAAEYLERPIVYLSKPQNSKEVMARAIAENDGITEGLICVLKAVVSCVSFGIYRSQETKSIPHVSGRGLPSQPLCPASGRVHLHGDLLPAGTAHADGDLLPSGAARSRVHLLCDRLSSGTTQSHRSRLRHGHGAGRVHLLRDPL